MKTLRLILAPISLFLGLIISLCAGPLDTWRVRDSLVQSSLQSVAYGNGVFVVVGDEGVVLRSIDGVSWANNPLEVTLHLRNVTYGNGIFVAIGSESRILVSTDGVNWDARDSGTLSGLNKITFWNNTFVVVGAAGTILTSGNGLTWTARVSGSVNLHGVAFDGRTFVAVGSFGAVRLSSDAEHWTIGSSLTSRDLYDVTYGGGVFVAVGESGESFSSTDGLVWLRRNSGTSATLGGISYGAGNFVAVGANGTIVSSVDGEVWTNRDSGTINFLRDLAYANGAFMAVGDYGTIIQSESVPPPMTLGEKAAELAKSVVGSEYLFGGKGFDWVQNTFVEAEQLYVGYNYWRCFVSRCGDPPTRMPCQSAFDKALDCSGLVFWSYNRASGASEYQSTRNPVYYENADAQYRWNSQPIDEGDLKPGDLIFFNYLHPSGALADHVAMYIGGNTSDDVVEAPGCTTGIKFSNKDDLMKRKGVFVGFQRIATPRVGLQVQAHSPVDLVVTDPDGFTITAQTFTVTEREVLREIAGALYYSESATGDDGRPGAVVTAPVLKTGTYFIRVLPKPDVVLSERFSLDVQAGTNVVILADHAIISDIPTLGYGIKSARGVIVPLTPVRLDITIAGGHIELSFPTELGKRYQAQYKDYLNDLMWADLGPVVTGLGIRMVISDDAIQKQRFYRIVDSE